MADLRVELYGQLVGRLTGADWRTFDFATDRTAFNTFSLGSTVLSESVPLDAIQSRGRAAQRRNFFAELLPEGDSLEVLAQRQRIVTHDTVGLLRAYGRDVAGALQIFDPAAPGEPKSPDIIAIDHAAVRRLLNNLQAQPLGNVPIKGKSSLAGVQPKAVLALIDGQWHQVIDGYPSTHIIKPHLDRHPTLIFDEEYGSRFVRALGLASFDTRLADFAGEPALVVERYDRSPDMPDGRIHQEDMNQALGARGSEKYQSHGGKVSLARIATVFSKRGDNDSVRRLLIATVLAAAVGNLDMHAKNISMLHFPDGRSTLAPMYDVVPQVHQDNDGELALAVNGVYAHREIKRDDLVAEARSWGIRTPEEAIDQALAQIATTAATESPDPRAYPDISGEISRFTQNLMSGKAAGDGAG